MEKHALKYFVGIVNDALIPDIHLSNKRISLMKDLFRGFYSPDDNSLKEIWRDDHTLFVFDANVLLNLYSYASTTRDDFYSILQELGDRIWLPYYAGLEYQRRRLNVVKNEKGVFKEIRDNLEKIEKIFSSDFRKLHLKRRFPKLSDKTEILEKEISKAISTYKKSLNHWDKQQPCVRSHDKVRKKLDDLFSGRVGEKPNSQEWLNQIYNEGKVRYEKKIPPGFQDADKANPKGGELFSYDGYEYNRVYGDLIIWSQVIEKARNEAVRNVIFITDDAKNDWWYTLSSNGEKTIGPLAELQEEIYRKAEIDKFHMYNTSNFLEHGKEHLDIEVNDSSIRDASNQTSKIPQFPISDLDLHNIADFIDLSVHSEKTYKTKFERPPSNTDYRIIHTGKGNRFIVMENGRLYPLQLGEEIGSDIHAPRYSRSELNFQSDLEHDQGTEENNNQDN